MSVLLLLAAVSPAGCAAAPAVTTGWTPLSAASLASAGNYTVKSTSLNELFQSVCFKGFLRLQKIKFFPLYVVVSSHADGLICPGLRYLTLRFLLPPQYSESEWNFVCAAHNI